MYHEQPDEYDFEEIRPELGGYVESMLRKMGSFGSRFRFLRTGDNPAPGRPWAGLWSVVLSFKPAVPWKTIPGMPNYGEDDGGAISEIELAIPIGRRLFSDRKDAEALDKAANVPDGAEAKEVAVLRTLRHVYDCLRVLRDEDWAMGRLAKAAQTSDGKDVIPSFLDIPGRNEPIIDVALRP